MGEGWHGRQSRGCLGWKETVAASSGKEEGSPTDEGWALGKGVCGIGRVGVLPRSGERPREGL